MKLLLTSGGIVNNSIRTALVEMMGKPLAEATALFVPTAEQPLGPFFVGRSAQNLLQHEWKAFGVTPKAGDVWLGNILRCVGRDPTRGYLAWSPTLTEEASFHVPERFGEFEFVK